MGVYQRLTPKRRGGARLRRPLGTAPPYSATARGPFPSATGTRHPNGASAEGAEGERARERRTPVPPQRSGAGQGAEWGLDDVGRGRSCGKADPEGAEHPSARARARWPGLPHGIADNSPREGVVGTRAHRVRTAATGKHRCPIPRCTPPKQPIEPETSVVARTRPVFLGFAHNVKQSLPTLSRVLSATTSGLLGGSLGGLLEGLLGGGLLRGLFGGLLGGLLRSLLRGLLGGSLGGLLIECQPPSVQWQPPSFNRVQPSDNLRPS